MRRDGYLVVRRFLPESDVLAIGHWLDELIALEEKPGRHWVYREESRQKAGVQLVQRIEKFCEHHSGLNDFVRHGAPAQWSESLLEGAVVLFKEKINFKMPGGGGFEAHQDQQAGWSRYAPHFITAMLTIDPAPVESGCLEIEAGRHRGGMIGEEWVPLAEKELDLRPIPTEPGDAIFLDSFVPHASRPNFTASPRRILFLTYNLAGHGDHRLRYYHDKHASFPPDIERDISKTYVFRV